MGLDVDPLAHGAACGQCEHDALGYVLRGGVGRDDYGVGECRACAPFDVGVGGDVFHFGSHGAHDVAFHPYVCGGFAFFFNGYCLGHAVGVAFVAGRHCRVAKIHAAVAVEQGELPCGAVVAEDAHHVAAAFGQRLVPEIGIAAGAGCERSAVGVHDVLAHAAAMVGGIGVHSAVLPCYVVEAHEASLVGLQACGGGGQLVEALNLERVHFCEVRQAVEFDSAGECLGSHEGYFPCLALLVPFFFAHLHVAVVFAYVHAREVEHDFLAAAILEVEVVAVDAEGECGCAVEDDKVLEHVAGLVAAEHYAADDEVLAFVEREVHSGLCGLVGELAAPRSHGYGVVGVFLPVEGFKLGYGNGGLVLGLGHRQVGVVEVVLACREAQGGSGGYGECLYV